MDQGASERSRPIDWVKAVRIRDKQLEWDQERWEVLEIYWYTATALDHTEPDAMLTVTCRRAHLNLSSSTFARPSPGPALDRYSDKRQRPRLTTSTLLLVFSKHEKRRSVVIEHNRDIKPLARVGSY